jgi:hypothetical protein
MELVVVIGSLILLALAAPRWGHDSRRWHNAGPWLADRGPAAPGAGRASAALAATRVALARLRQAPRAHAPRPGRRARAAGALS